MTQPEPSRRPVILAERVVQPERGQCNSALAHKNCRYAGDQLQRDGYVVPMCAKPDGMVCEYFAQQLSLGVYPLEAVQ